MNCIHFQMAMLAYNLNCWLMLFNREEGLAEDLKHTTLATSRLRFLFLAANLATRREGGGQLQRPLRRAGIFQRLMQRLERSRSARRATRRCWPWPSAPELR